jgi:hypothetical protein
MDMSDAKAHNTRAALTHQQLPALTGPRFCKLKRLEPERISRRLRMAAVTAAMTAKHSMPHLKDRLNRSKDKQFVPSHLLLAEVASRALDSAAHCAPTPWWSLEYPFVSELKRRLQGPSEAMIIPTKIAEVAAIATRI